MPGALLGVVVGPAQEREEGRGGPLARVDHRDPALGAVDGVGQEHVRRPEVVCVALREVRTLPGEEALALISSLHVGLVRERDDALAAQEALRAIREARIAAALRTAGYRIPEVRETMGALRGFHRVDDPLDSLEERVGTIARRMAALLRAGAELAGLTHAVRSGPRE